MRETLTRLEQILSDQLRIENEARDTHVDVDAIDRRYLEMVKDRLFINVRIRKNFALFCYNQYLDLMRRGLDPNEVDRKREEERQASFRKFIYGGKNPLTTPTL